MKETLFLWWRMRNYQPPTTAPNPQRAHGIGDSLTGAASLAIAAVRRRVGNK
jgi:hypothetical protein